MWGSPPIDVPPDAVVAWGARAIHEPRGRGFDLPPDRKGFRAGDHDKNPEAFAALARWLDNGMLQRARDWAKTVDGGSGKDFFVSEGDFVFKCTPNCSYGYIYMAAWAVP